MFSEVRASTSSQTTASEGKPAAAFSARTAASETSESMCSIAIEPSWWTSSSFRSLDDHARVLAGDVAEDHIALGLLRGALEVDEIDDRVRLAEEVQGMLGVVAGNHDPKMDHGG